MKALRLSTAATLALASAVSGALAAQTVQVPAAHPISLSEAIRLADRNSPQSVQARGQVRSNNAAVRAAWQSFIPSVGVSATGQRQINAVGRTFTDQNGQRITTQPIPWTYQNGIGLNLDLFDGGQRWFDLRTARANVGAAESGTVTQRFQVALNVSQQYFNALAARESEDAARAQLQQAEQQLRAASARVAAGAATKSDSLRSVIQVGNARLALVTAQNNLRVADASLTRLVGSTVPVTANLADTVGAFAPLPDSAQLLRMAENGPAVVQATASVSAARAARRAARISGYLPTLSMSYNRGGNGAAEDLRFINDDFSYVSRMTFFVNYQLFNQGVREAAVVRAEVAEDNADAALRDARLLAQQSLVQFLGAGTSAQERISIQEASVAAAEEDLRVQQQRYALGASTLLDVLTSQTQLSQAQSALIQARLDYRVSRAQIESLIGRNLQ